MEKYIRLRKPFSSMTKRSKSSPPRSIPHDRDANGNFTTRLNSINHSVDDKIEATFINLLSRVSSMWKILNIGVLTNLFLVPLRCWGNQRSDTYAEPASSRSNRQIRWPSGPSVLEGRRGSGTASSGFRSV